MWPASVPCTLLFRLTPITVLDQKNLWQFAALGIAMAELNHNAAASFHHTLAGVYAICVDRRNTSVASLMITFEVCQLCSIPRGRGISRNGERSVLVAVRHPIHHSSNMCSTPTPSLV